MVVGGEGKVWVSEVGGGGGILVVSGQNRLLKMKRRKTRQEESHGGITPSKHVERGR